MKICVLVFLLLFSLNTYSAVAESVTFDSSSNIVSIKSGSSTERRCALFKELKDVAPRFNWNKTIVILTDVDFVTTRDVEVCSHGSVDPSHIPHKVGFLVDVNPEYKVYLALDVAGVSPMTFIATVARLGETRSMLSVPGVFSDRKADEKIKEESFSYVETNSGRISPNGRYVSADGSMSCGPDAYPGVWDLLLKKNVISEARCDTLFEDKNPSAVNSN